MRKFFEKNSVLKIVSLFIAILVWLYVIYIEDPKVTVKIDDVPVSYKVTELPESLSLVDYDVKTIDVKISGDRSEIVDFEKDDISAFLDLSVVSESGQYDNIKIETSVSNKNVEIVERSDKKSAVQIDNVISSRVDVSAKLTGEVAKGYSVTEKPILILDTIMVSGAKTYVDMVKSAYINIDCTDFDKSKTVSSKIILTDKNGNDIIKGHRAYKHLTPSHKDVSAYITVSKTSEIKE